MLLSLIFTCYDDHYDFRLDLQLFVGGFMSYIRIVVSNTYCIVFFFFVLCTLSTLITPSVFSNVYLLYIIFFLVDDLYSSTTFLSSFCLPYLIARALTSFLHQYNVMIFYEMSLAVVLTPMYYFPLSFN